MSVLVQKKRITPELECKLLEKLAKIEGDYLWISSNEEKLKKTHLNMYVAVKGKRVVFESSDFEALLKVLIASNQDVDSFAVKHVKKDSPCLLL